MRKILVCAAQVILLTALFGPAIAAISDNLVGTDAFQFFQRNATEMGLAFRQLIIFLSTCLFMALVKASPRTPRKGLV